MGWAVEDSVVFTIAGKASVLVCTSLPLASAAVEEATDVVRRGVSGVSAASLRWEKRPASLGVECRCVQV